MPVEEVYPQGFHRTGPIAAQWTRLDQVVLTDVLVLEVSSHRDLPLETPIADRTVVRQCFGVRGKVFRQVVFSEEPLLADSTLVRLDTRVTHLVTPHVGAV